MNRFDTAARFYSVALAAVFTLGMLVSVDNLATTPQVAAHTAQAHSALAQA